MLDGNEIYSDKQIKDIQREDLKIAQYFVDFCVKNNLLCYLCGGGCIGAIRHEGFIPWDDDLDFFMPRDSYNKLIKLWDNRMTSPFVLRSPNKLYNDHDMFTSIRDVNTTMVKHYQAALDIPHGIAIDIFPLDGCPNSKFSRKIQLLWALVYQLFCAQIIPNNHGKAVKIIAKLALGIFKSNKMRYKIWRLAEKEMSKYDFDKAQYVTEICAGPKYMFNMYPQKLFSKAIWRSFEDDKMPIPIGYDKYLKMVFGNYMELPPEDQRVTHHNNLVVDCHNSYLNYIKKKANK